jgi:hypothetical protein
MIKAASFYRLSSVVKKNPWFSVGSGDRLSGGAKIFGQKCQDGGEPPRFIPPVNLSSSNVLNGLTRECCLRE